MIRLDLKTRVTLALLFNRRKSFLKFGFVYMYSHLRWTSCVYLLKKYLRDLTPSYFNSQHSTKQIANSIRYLNYYTLSITFKNSNQSFQVGQMDENVAAKILFLDLANGMEHNRKHTPNSLSKLAKNLPCGRPNIRVGETVIFFQPTLRVQ